MRCVCWPVCLFGDVFAHGRFGDFVGIGLSGRDFLRGHMLLELARKEVHDYNPVSGGAGGIGVGLRFPRMQVGVVNDCQINAICEQSSVDFPTCAENRLSCRLFYSEEREDDKTTEGNGSCDTRLDSLQDGNHRTDRKTTIGGSYAEWEAK